MATKLETIITLVDKTAAPFVRFNKRVHDVMRPLGKLEYSLNRLGRVSGLRSIGAGFIGLKDSASKAVDSFAKMGATIGIATGAIGFGLHKLSDLAVQGDNLAKTSRRLGMSAEELQKFRYVSNLAGVSAEDFTKSVQRLSMSSVRATVATSKEAKAMSALGINVKDTNGNLKNNEEILLSLSERFSQTGPSALSASEKIFAANELLGKSGVNMIELLNQGPEKLRAQFKEIEKYGVMSKEQAEASEAYNDSLTRMQAALNGLGIVAGGQILPVMQKAVEGLTGLFVNHREEYVSSIGKIANSVTKFIQIVAERIPTLLNITSKVLDVIGTVVDKIGIVAPMFTIAFGSIFIPLVGVAKSCTKIFTAITGTLVRFIVGCIPPISKMRNAFKIAFHSIISFISKFGRTLLNVFPKAFSCIAKFGSVTKLVVPALKIFGVALRGAFGPLGWALFAFETLSPLIKSIAKEWEALSFASLDDGINSISRIVDLCRNWLDTLGPIGSILKSVGNVGNKIFGSTFGNKVDFSGAPKDEIAAAFEEVQNPSVGVTKSELFNTSTTTTTINRNTRSVFDVNFNNVPKDVTIKRHNYSGEEFGNISSFAY